jgi:hypothetical protein
VWHVRLLGVSAGGAGPEDLADTVNNLLAYDGEFLHSRYSCTLSNNCSSGGAAASRMQGVTAVPQHQHISLIHQPHVAR